MISLWIRQDKRPSRQQKRQREINFLYFNDNIATETKRIMCKVINYNGRFSKSFDFNRTGSGNTHREK